MPFHCACGEKNSIDHCLICKKGGYVVLRHNTLRDTIAGMLEKVCSDVVTEPKLLPVTGEVLTPGTANRANDARLDISARSFWYTLGRSLFDVRVFHPGSPSNASKDIQQMYLSHENEKKRLYNSRVIEIEKATFTPLVFSTSGGMSMETEKFMAKLSQKMSERTNQEYSDCISFVRKRLRFDLLKTCIISLRGQRGRYYNKPCNINEMDWNHLSVE